MKEIIITVKPNGETIIETQGYSGSECLEASKKLEAALGVKVKEQFTPELYNSTIERLKQSQS